MLVTIAPKNCLRVLGKYYNPGETVELGILEAKKLKAKGVVSYEDGEVIGTVIQPQKPEQKIVHDDSAVIAELTEVVGVTKQIAEAMIGLGISGGSDLQEKDAETLCKLKGVSMKLAEKILLSARNDFIVED